VILLIDLIRESLVRYESTAHLPLLLAASGTAQIGIRLGFRWNEIEDGIIA
jgi:hypothetical protein